ncbi:DUF2178 domain-containing protein [Salipaludibacillus agaradhaerens]|jgi:hypothetical protein|uniref:DUF2178 domain-containing protein n=1 Tax=Salipaludibacillus agaradhaerens TaxID=76935 RepID=UPI0021516444|nr:DUF2178 domain-containing protein [Salipaludibacillus agaradhaerens]MCR6107863.1 DUF2178 domain-containing protein [Salipaludibacillus agaradhaerens]MCR6119892.1 DUF2178 domain-containing protein [Salipaludibacillus agaradhaerens]
MTKSWNVFLTLWAPIIFIITSIAFFFWGQNLWVIGILIIGIALNTLTDLKLKGTDVDEDERYKYIVLRSSDMSNRISGTVLIILTVVHFFFSPLEGSLILIILLLVHYVSEALSSILIGNRS